MSDHDARCRSWFCVFNNPEDHGLEGTPEQIVDRMIEIWMEDNPQRTCAVTYCVSAEGLRHCHAVFEDTQVMRFTVIKKLFPSMHIEPTKGNKQQAEDYINKRGKFEEKGEIVVYTNRCGEIKGAQGQRKEFEEIEDMIQQGKTPNEILAVSFSYRRYAKMINDAYFWKRLKETPQKREVVRYWHVGYSGSGKSYTRVQLSEKVGEDHLYIVSGDYEHGFDKYNGERVLFMDEFRGQMPFWYFMQLLDVYKAQLKCRYANSYALWNEVHIASVLPPEMVYRDMVQTHQHLDTYEQLRRRIDFMVYHFKQDCEYRSFVMPMEQYKGYDDMKKIAEDYVGSFVGNLLESPM